MQRERVGANRIHPPRAQPHHHQRGVSDRQQHAHRAADDGQQHAFRQEEAAHACGAKPDRAKETDFTAPLLDAKLEKQRGQDQRRGYEKETEIDEIRAKVSRASRRSQTTGSYVTNGHTQRKWVHDLAQMVRVSHPHVLDRLACSRRDAKRREGSVP